jgi:NADH-quinone oxidoreductase subunit A
MALGALIRPRRKTDEGLEVYECGEETRGDAWVKFDIRYYTVALVYVIFAVEIAFLFPWAIVLGDALAGTGAGAGKGIGGFALLEGVIFILILFLGLAYVWAKGDLDWVLHYRGERFRPAEPPSERRSIRPIAALQEEVAAAAAPHADAAHEQQSEEVAV